MPAPPKGELFAVAGRFLIAPEALATGLTACALSVTYGDSSPKGRAKSTAGHFLISPKALATGFKSWLPLRGKTSPAPGEDVTAGDKRGNLARERLRGRAREISHICRMKIRIPQKNCRTACSSSINPFYNLFFLSTQVPLSRGFQVFRCRNTAQLCNLESRC